MASNAAEVAVDFLAMLNGVGIALDGLPFVNWQARAISCPPSQKQTRMMVAAVGAVEVSCWRKVGPLIAVQTVAAPLNNDPIQNDCSVAGVDRESVLAALQHMNKCQVATDLALLMTEALLCSDGVRLELLSRSMGRGRVVKAGMSSTEASLRYPVHATSSAYLHTMDRAMSCSMWTFSSRTCGLCACMWNSRPAK